MRKLGTELLKKLEEDDIVRVYPTKFWIKDKLTINPKLRKVRLE